MQLNRWKVNGTGRLNGIALAALLGWTSGAVAGSVCDYLRSKYGWQCDSVGTWSCLEETYWNSPVDLDGDGVSDFVLSHRWGMSRCDSLYSANYDATAAETWALFPEAHVQVLGWWQWYQPGVNPPALASPALPPGYPIVPDPATLRAPWKPSAWAEPHLQAHIHGYGIGYTVESYICLGETCPLPRAVGLLNVNIWDALFGVRIFRADGWHLGWIHVSSYGLPKPLPEGRSTRADMDDYAIHPDPDTEIAAGQPPQPRLRYALEGDRVRLWWSAAWTGYRLEHASALADAPWEAVEGVVDRSVTLPKGVGARFFRLVQPPGP